MSREDRKPKENKASKEEQILTASNRELKAIEARTKNWSEKQDNRPGSKNKNAKYTSNKTHYSPTDPDARISVKPGKARKLNYQSQMAVDTEHHVITHIHADYADKHDSRCLTGMVDILGRRLKGHGLMLEHVLADTGYSSGENYAQLEARGIDAYIPPHGTYKGGPEGFTYYKEEDYWECPQGKQLTFHKLTEEESNPKRIYRTRRIDCRGCRLAESCKKQSWEKRITVTHYREEYERAKVRINSAKGRSMKAKRQATVEPVFGTLTQYLGMRKVNTKGIANANKQFMMAAMAYNLKKYLKFTTKTVQSMAKSATAFCAQLFNPIRLERNPNPPFKFWRVKICY
jgi:hypothetical protein